MFFILFQGDEIGRIFAILVAQLLFSFIFLYLAYKILKRNRNRLSITLSSFYISEGIAFILGAIYLPIRINPIVYILYFGAVYLIFIGPIFLLMFILILLKIDFKLKNQLIIIIIYALIVFILLNLPGGISINEDTNWTPLWSLSFILILNLFMTCVIVIPFFFLFTKLYKTFEDKALKKKLKYFLIGFCGIIITFYGGGLYNTQIYPLFNFIWNFVLLFILIPSALLIYYAWGHGI